MVANAGAFGHHSFGLFADAARDLGTGSVGLVAALREAVGAGEVHRLEEVRRLLAGPERAGRARIYYTVRFAMGRPEGVEEAAQIAASVHRNACLLVEAATAAAAGSLPPGEKATPVAFAFSCLTVGEAATQIVCRHPKPGARYSAAFRIRS
jgi:hypothetical protein